MNSEKWRPIPGFYGYEASDKGRIRSVDRIAHGRKYKGLIMKSAPGSSGYPKVQIGKGNHIHVHKAVLMAFRGLPPAGMEGCHNNGDRADNRLENLRWGTRSENALDREKHGNGIGGESNPNLKITDTEVRAIRRLREKGWKLREIADRFGITPTNASYVCRGITRNG